MIRGCPEIMDACDVDPFCSQPETRVEARPDFFIWIRCNPLKSPDSAKGKQGNASFFPWFSLDFLEELRALVVVMTARRAPGLPLQQQAARFIVDGPIAGGDDPSPLGGVLAVPGRHHAARPLDDRREGDDVVRFEVG